MYELLVSIPLLFSTLAAVDPVLLMPNVKIETCSLDDVPLGLAPLNGGEDMAPLIWTQPSAGNEGPAFCTD